MFEIGANLSEVLGGLLFLVWAGAGYRVKRLAYRSRPARSARWILVHLAAGVLVLLVQTGLVVMLWTVDWEFASNRVVLAVPIVAVPVAVVCALSVPRLLRGGNASDPLLVVPVQAAAIGSLLDFWVVFIDRPVPPYTAYAIVAWALLLAGTGLQWWRLSRRPDPAPRRGLIARGLTAAGVLAVVAVAVLAVIVVGAHRSRLPDSLDPAAMAGAPAGGAHQHHTRSVTELTGPRTGTPDVRYTLTAQPARIRLASGRTVDAWTFNGQVPGPELRMRRGQLVEVTLVNRLPAHGVTLHWHGLDVPNAEDGVAGVTQDAVQPGHSFTYRFRPEQAGSFWYHSHEESAEAVDRGLFGPLIVLPDRGEPAAVDIPVMAHTWATGTGRAEAFGTADTLQRRNVPAGTRVRLRLINTSDNTTEDLVPRTLVFSGAPVTVSAIDGTDLNRPGVLGPVRLEMAIGGRFDLSFTMPGGPVRLTDLLDPAAGLVLAPGDSPVPPLPSATTLFDPATYGEPAATPFGAPSHFDRRYRLILDDGPGFYDGRFTFPPTINGKVFPDTPMLMVSEGDLVQVTIVDRGHNDHPMHLHGHHVLVLSRNRVPVSGSPWWSDTLEVKPGEIYEIAFRADNPGLWMDHCHNLQHAATGMVMHLAYEGVTSPFRVGHATINHPE